MDPIEHARTLFFRALDHHQRGRLNEAEALYREALALVPERVSVLSNLGAVLVMQGRHAEARVLAERALALEHDCAEAHAILAELKRSQQGPQAALADLDRALAAQPDDPDLLFQRSGLLAELGRFDEAVADSTRGLKQRPGHAASRAHHALLRAARGELAPAQAELGALLHHDARPLAAGEAWAQLLLRRAAEAQGVLPADTDSKLLTRALDTPWAPPRHLLGHACQALHADPRTGPWLQRVQQAWPQPLPAHSWSDLRLGAAVYSQPLLRALLRQPVIPDAGTQRLLAQLRAALLERALHSRAELGWNEALQSFHCALAAHCLRQQHAWPTDAAESSMLDALQRQLRSAIDAADPVPAAWLPALLSYVPLAAFAAEGTLSRQRWPVPVQALLSQAIAAPSVLPALRWTHLPASPRGLALDDYLSERIAPFAAPVLPPTPQPRVLALAAGGGEWAFELALRLRGAQVRVLEADPAAVAALTDQIQRLRLPRLSVGRGGLESAGAGGYSVIDSGRSLFQRGSLQARLSELKPWLAPRGLLRLRVPSARLRSALRAAHAHLQEWHFDPRTDDLRGARARLLELPAQDPAALLHALPEFHALGPCRSALLDWDASPLDLPGLVQQLQAAGLRFRALELGPDERAALPKVDALPQDIPAWAALEAAQPRMFRDFYTVWASA